MGSFEREWPGPAARVGLRPWARVGLVVAAGAVLGVFLIALRLNPYKGGKVWLEGTHQQLNLPECTFKYITRRPCPTCGMTSSFALLVRGDVANSLQANSAGTLLALVLAAFVPWGLASAWRGRLLFVRSPEWAVVRVLGVVLILMFARWGLVLASSW